MWSIRQDGDNWVVERSEGNVLTVVGEPHASYPVALAALTAEIQSSLAEGDGADTGTSTEDGLLAESWTDDGGICFSEATGDGRDFSTVQWSWRDPNVSLLPLMLQTETDVSHFGAQLAGFIAELSDDSGTVHSGGRFYDSETGRAARDLLLGDRRFGVSVDPGHVVASWECTEEDDEGWCMEERAIFEEYQIIGLTMTPFPAFERAAIRLATSTATTDTAPPADGEAAVVTDATLAAEGDAAVTPSISDHDFTDGNSDGFCDYCMSADDNGDCLQQCGAVDAMHDSTDNSNSEGDGEDQTDSGDGNAAVAASAVAVVGFRIPASPPASWFHMPEPEPGMTASVDTYGMPANELLVEQPDGSLAVPMTITDDGRVFGHLARWGQCHVGSPGQCISPPQSACSYAHFHVGEVRCEENVRVPVGTLTIGCEHAPLRGLSASEARDHYAHAGMGWANVRAVDGQYGPWCSGVLRPDVTEEQVRILRSLSMSGDWRRLGGNLELIGALAVNVPGFPIVRDVITASGLGLVASARPGGAYTDDQPDALVAAGVVHRCTECQKRLAAEMRAQAATTVITLDEDSRSVLRQIEAKLGVIERRTRPLIASERESLAESIRRPLRSNGNGSGE